MRDPQGPQTAFASERSWTSWRTPRVPTRCSSGIKHLAANSETSDVLQAAMKEWGGQARARRARSTRAPRATGRGIAYVRGGPR